MLEVRNLCKNFDGKEILKDLSISFQPGSVYGLVGSNGAGKSTLLRLICGVYTGNSGEIILDDVSLFDNHELMGKIAFVSDELYFLPQSNMKRMAELYASSYPNFNRQRFEELTKAFGLNPTKKISTFSKGMKRQAASILAMCSGAEYIFLDETFDGLDPVMRNLLKNVIYDDVTEKNTCVIITSHSLRELEDTCDKLALLHEGGIVFESDIDDLQTTLVKAQIAFGDSDFGKDKFKELNILDYSKRGSVANLIIRGSREDVNYTLSSMQPILLDILPLSLEEVFIYELGSRGYSFDEYLGKKEG
ncbi:MAG: ABC transporter ATP-binding protein [Clostridia bacterium]|nr:ABC transporter ATP-binding protein [Clostridia bacterium]